MTLGARAAVTSPFAGSIRSRISQTFDGIPLNDTGNYAIYTNQQVDPELVETINVNLGSTDVDSPTAAAVGGTVNINTLVPSEELGGTVSASYGNILSKGAGDRPYHRVFGMIQTGTFTPWGTRAWFSASQTSNDAAFANYGQVEKQQYNGKIYQPIGDNGDFISIAGHYNENRNNFGGSPLRANAITGDKKGRFYDIANGYPCCAQHHQHDQRLRYRFRASLQPLEHRQHPLAIALLARPIA